eukprot:173177-Chlamydomonas_euryale.AAC.1
MQTRRRRRRPTGLPTMRAADAAGAVHRSCRGTGATPSSLLLSVAPLCQHRCRRRRDRRPRDRNRVLHAAWLTPQRCTLRGLCAAAAAAVIAATAERRGAYRRRAVAAAAELIGVGAARQAVAPPACSRRRLRAQVRRTSRRAAAHLSVQPGRRRAVGRRRRRRADCHRVSQWPPVLLLQLLPCGGRPRGSG